MSDVKFEMNGPVQFEMKVWVINDETGQEGRITISMSTFKYPTIEKIERSIKEIDFGGTFEGFRLMTRREAFDSFTLEKTGQKFALVGGEDWDSARAN